MKNTLYEIIKGLKNNLIPKIQFEISNTSALENISHTIYYLKRLYDFSLRYLFLVFNDTANVPNNITTGQLAKPSFEGLKKVMNTDIAKFIQQIALSPHSLGNIDTINQTDMNQIQIDVEDDQCQVAIKEIDTNVIPFDVTSTSLTDKWKQCKTDENGMANFFIKIYIVELYINTLRLMQEMAKFAYIFALAKNCAKLGGDLLVFGFCNQEFNNDLISCAQHISKLKESLDKLNDIALEQWHIIGATNIASEKNWKQNYKMAKMDYEQVEKDYTLCHKYLSSLSISANKYTPKELANEAIKARDNYLINHKRFRQYRNKVSFIQNNHLDNNTEYLNNLEYLTKNAGFFNIKDQKTISYIDSLVYECEKLCKQNKIDEAFELAVKILKSTKKDLDRGFRCITLFSQVEKYEIAIVLLKNTLLNQENKDHENFKNWHFFAANIYYLLYKSDNTREVDKKGLLEEAKKSLDIILNIDAYYPKLAELRNSIMNELSNICIGQVPHRNHP